MGSRARFVVQERAQMVVGAEEDGRDGKLPDLKHLIWSRCLRCWLRWSIMGCLPSSCCTLSRQLPKMALHFSIVPRVLGRHCGEYVPTTSSREAPATGSEGHHDDLIDGAVLLEIMWPRTGAHPSSNSLFLWHHCLWMVVEKRRRV
jgi:hypothetical protein